MKHSTTPIQSFQKVRDMAEKDEDILIEGSAESLKENNLCIVLSKKEFREEAEEINPEILFLDSVHKSLEEIKYFLCEL